jgi:hypothetical protein
MQNRFKPSQAKLSIMVLAAVCAVDPGDTTWMLISFVLVLFMLPALVLFEAGLLRSKNSVSIAAQVVACLLILSTMYVCACSRALNVCECVCVCHHNLSLFYVVSLHACAFC